jgi:hypothetical protein
LSTKKKTQLEAECDFRKIHGDKYRYGTYVNNRTKMQIFCPIHGEFWQTPKQHLRGQGCPECGKIKNKIRSKRQTSNGKRLMNITKDEFIKLANIKYQNKYDYSDINYISYCKNKIKIKCPKHGIFEQYPNQHLRACGCVGCVSEHKRELFHLKLNVFKERAKKLFHDKYTYDNVTEIINTYTKIPITCKIHGDFLCSPNNHLKGRGCPICKNETYVYENRLFCFLKTFLDEHEIIRQARPIWLTNNKSLDFYIPKYKLAIEHQGEQHFNEVKYFTQQGKAKLERTRELDFEKYNECTKNNIRLLYFSYEYCAKKQNIDFFPKSLYKRKRNKRTNFRYN